MKISAILRFTGRLLVVALILYQLGGRVYQGGNVMKFYQAQFLQVNDMLHHFRLKLPSVPQNSQIYHVLLYLDIGYLIVAMLLILLGRRKGGWMIALWYMVFLFTDALPRLLKAPRMPFTVHMALQYFKFLAIVGVGVALTAQSDQKQKVKAD